MNRAQRFKERNVKSRRIPSGNYFLDNKALSQAKHEEEIFNSQLKRGEIENGEKQTNRIHWAVGSGRVLYSTIEHNEYLGYRRFGYR
jgi:hypothetical protein